MNLQQPCMKPLRATMNSPQITGWWPLRAAGDCEFMGFELQYRRDGVETWTSMPLGSEPLGCTGGWRFQYDLAIFSLFSIVPTGKMASNWPAWDQCSIMANNCPGVNAGWGRVDPILIAATDESRSIGPWVWHDMAWYGIGSPKTNENKDSFTRTKALPETFHFFASKDTFRLGILSAAGQWF